MFAGLASGHILIVDMATSNIASMGLHDSPISGLFWLKEKGILMSLGFDKFIKFWSLEQLNQVQAELNLPLKTVTCNYDYPYLLIGSA
jgi:WD40 repeat protein